MSANSFRLPETRVIPPGPRWGEIEDDDVIRTRRYIEILQKIIGGNCKLISLSEHLNLKFLIEKLEQEITQGKIRCPPPQRCKNYIMYII